MNDVIADTEILKIIFTVIYRLETVILFSVHCEIGLCSESVQLFH